MAKLTSADNKFIAKFLNGDKLDFDSNVTFTRLNEFTGETAELDPICAAAFDFIKKVEGALENKAELKKISPALTLGNAVQSFDRARYLIMKMNLTAYYTLLD